MKERVNMESIYHKDGPAPSLTAAAGSISEMVSDLDRSYLGMESLACDIIATIETNFEKGSITTREGKGDEILREMIVGWKNRLYRYRQNLPGQDSSNIEPTRREPDGSGSQQH